MISKNHSSILYHHSLARKINIGKFRNGTSKVLIVTDVAARGLDIPLLDCVINYDFVDSTKLFVHRVGRVARAGRSGMAYNLISPDEVCEESSFTFRVRLLIN